MSNTEYKRMLQLVLDTIKSAAAIVDSDNRLIACELPGNRRLSRRAVGKPFERLLRLILDNEAADKIAAAVSKARQTVGEVKLDKVRCKNMRRLDYYLHIRCNADSNGAVIICFNNITESVLLVNEFSSMLEEHAAFISQLEASIAKLELQLMEK